MTTISTCAHEVSFHAAGDQLAATVTGFLVSPLVAGQAVVVVATPEHLVRFAAALTAAGADLAAARAQGRYVEHDAADLLARLVGADGPSAARFEELVTAPLDDLATRFGAVAVYGEMVGLLASAGELVPALQLEELWDAAIARLPLRLLCGYPAASLAGDQQGQAAVRAGHDRVARDVEATVALGLQSDAAPTTARRAALERCVAWGLVDEEWADDAALVVTELVGNAVRHTGTGLVLQLDRHDGTVTLVVTDGSGSLPVEREASEDAEHGRGLLIVDVLAERWGVEQRPRGKAVWARLRQHPTSGVVAA